jgi:hypothetical protein
MSEPIVYIDRSEVRDGRLEDLKLALDGLVEFIEANEPRLVAYNVYFSEGDEQVTVVHVHRDSASLEFHMKVAGPVFAQFAGLVNLLAIDVYGDPSEDLLEQLRQKATLLGSGNVRVHGLHAGFSRLTPRARRRR